uniref:Uncharacterized protein n=1 Tax=Anguilla anguilla TaxID=7936 RepID=A0A0E9S9U2_ANGAN
MPDRNLRNLPMENRPMKPSSCSLICSFSKPPCVSDVTHISRRPSNRIKSSNILNAIVV